MIRIHPLYEVPSRYRWTYPRAFGIYADGVLVAVVRSYPSRLVR